MWFLSNQICNFKQAFSQEIRINLQLFGTDIDQLAIDRAREGLFPASITDDITQERLQRFFTQEGEL